MADVPPAVAPAVVQPLQESFEIVAALRFYLVLAVEPAVVRPVHVDFAVEVRPVAAVLFLLDAA